jgi:CO/xanthine dehydrogenase FAD-binding subunit
LQNFAYISALTIQDVITHLSNSHRQVRLLSGGTDLLVQLREGRRQADLVIDLKNIPELTAISYNPDDGLRIGAAAACSRICQHREVRLHFPGLVDAFSLIGGVQIQNRASVGGNLCNASPAADAIPALIVYEATCLIAGPDGTRQAPVDLFCTAPGKTILQPDEFLVFIQVPPPPSRFGASYLRFIPRGEMDIAIVGAGAAVRLDESGQHIESARLALGAVAPTPLYVPQVGEFLAGQPINDQNIEEAARIAQEAARPISDMRGTIAQRKHLSGVLARRALFNAISRARQEEVVNGE